MQAVVKYYCRGVGHSFKCSGGSADCGFVVATGLVSSEQHVAMKNAWFGSTFALTGNRGLRLTGKIPTAAMFAHWLAKG